MIQHRKSDNLFTLHNPKQLLIINADDYGYNSHIDRGILELLTHRHIKSVSVIVNGANISQAAELIHEFKALRNESYLDCSIGLHLNLTQGQPLNPKLHGSTLTENGCFRGKPGFYTAIGEVDDALVLELAEELRLQIQRFIKLFDRRPSHLDGHNHVHLVPKLARVFAPVMKQLGIYRVRGLECTLQHITIEMNHTFLNNHRQAKQYYEQNYIVSPAGFVGLESFGNLNPEELGKQLLQQKEKSFTYQSVELMCHPGYPDSVGVPWIASPDRFKELQQLQSQPFQQLRQTVGNHSYLDLKDKADNQKNPRVLIYSKLERGCGNQTTTLRLQCILEQMGFKVYLWNVVDTIDTHTEAHDLYKFLLNFGISLVIGVNATRSAEIIYLATQGIRVPYFLIIAGTDANITFQDNCALQKIGRALKGCQCLIALSQGMTAITRKVIEQLQINKAVYTIVQSSCLSKALQATNDLPRHQPNKRPYILFPTSFRKVKCVHHLLHQLNTIIDTYDHDVIIAGPVLDDLYFADCLPHLGKIQYLGVLSKGLYAQYLQNAALVINTSESEGMSCSILEAFQMKIPVIARRNPGNQQLVKHRLNGLLYTTPEQFMALFMQLKDNKALKAAFVENSYEVLKEKYSFEKQCLLYRDVIEKQYKSKVQAIEIEDKAIKVFNRSEVHPVSGPNLNLFRQIRHHFNPGSNVLDLGCGSGIFSLITLTNASHLSQIHLYLTDIYPELISHAVYNLRQSNIWHSIDKVVGIRSDMFQEIDDKIAFDVILFNPPQSPFRYAGSRPDKNGGQDALKYIRIALNFLSTHPQTTMYLLHSLLAWPSMVRELVQSNKLRVQWQSQMEIHRIEKQQYDKMQEDLSLYILGHLQKGRGEVQFKEGVFLVPALIYRVGCQ